MKLNECKVMYSMQKTLGKDLAIPQSEILGICNETGVLIYTLANQMPPY